MRKKIKAISLFPVDGEYGRCVQPSCNTGILTLLPQSEGLGTEGKLEYAHMIHGIEQIKYIIGDFNIIGN